MADEKNVALTHKYEPFIHTRQHNLFTEEFFSGPDVSIFFDGKEVKEISELSYNVQEQLKPIYGYDSMVFDDVAVGSRVVIGTFTVPISNEMATQDPTILTYVEEPVESLPAWVAVQKQRIPVATTRQAENLMVYNLQRYLLKIGYDLELNGVLDYETSKALNEYQMAHRMNPVGEVTDELILKLQVEAGESQAESTKEFVLLHVKPTFKSRACGELKPQTPYVKLNEVEEWTLISSFDGAKGYVLTSIL